MEGFVKEKPSIIQSLITPLAFVGIGVTALIVAGYLYFKTPHQEAASEAAQPPPASQTTLAQNTNPPNQPSTTALSRSAEPANPNQRYIPPTAPRPQGAQAGAVAANPAESPAKPSPTEGRAEASAVQIEFDLANRDVMERLTQEGDGRLEVGRYTMSVVPQFKTKYETARSDKGFESLASESRNLSMGQPSLVFRGGKVEKTNDTIGFYVEVTPSRQTERGTEYKISIKRSLPEISAQGEVKVSSQPFDESVVVPQGAAVVIAGLLPRKQQLFEGEETLYQGNVLSPILRPAFEKGDEEFLIIINPKFSQPSS